MTSFAPLSLASDHDRVRRVSETMRREMIERAIVRAENANLILHRGSMDASERATLELAEVIRLLRRAS